MDNDPHLVHRISPVPVSSKIRDDLRFIHLTSPPPSITPLLSCTSSAITPDGRPFTVEGIFFRSCDTAKDANYLSRVTDGGTNKP